MLCKKPNGPQSFWRAVQQNMKELMGIKNPPSRPQARWRCVSISGSGVNDPSGSPEGSGLWRAPRRVQGSALPLSA